MQPPDQDDRELICFRDNTVVRGDSPRCLHPSGQCDFRPVCQVRDAEHASRRNRGESGS